MAVFHIDISGTWKILLEKLYEVVTQTVVYRTWCYQNKFVFFFLRGNLNISLSPTLCSQTVSKMFFPLSFYRGLYGLTLGKKVCLGGCTLPVSLSLCFYLPYSPLVQPVSHTHISLLPQSYTSFALRNNWLPFCRMFAVSKKPLGADHLAWKNESLMAGL